MKSFSRIFTLILFITLAVIGPVSSAYASSTDEAVPNPAAEIFLLDHLRTAGSADLESFPEAERNISGLALVNALKDPQVQSHSLIYIANITVVDAVQANDLMLAGNLQFFRANFADYIDLNSSELHDVWIDESTFQGSVNFQLATFNGNIGMSKNTFEDLWFQQSEINGSINLGDNTFNIGVNFNGAHVTEEMLFNGSKFLGTEIPPDASSPVEFWTMTVDGLTSFVEAHFAGSANFAQSQFLRLDMQGVRFDRDVDFSGVTVDRSADFTSASFGQKANFQNFSAGNTATFDGVTFSGEAVFKSATVARDVSFANASFKGAANFDYITVGRFCDFIGTTFKDLFSFSYTSVAWPYFDGATFDGPVVFDGTQASEDFEIDNTSYNYTEKPFALTLVTVEGALKFADFSAPAGLQLSQSRFESVKIDAADKLETQFIDIHETDIENELTIRNISMASLIADGATIGKSTNLSKVSIKEELDMRNASIGFLKMDQSLQWPTNPDHFNLRGMTYTDIDIGNKGLTEENFQALLALVNHSAYSPQAYEQLSQFLTDKGHPDWAAEVQLNQKRRERSKVLTPLSGAWLWSWFLDIFAGYGHRPVFAFVWSGLVIAAGAFVFRRREDMIPIDQGDAKVEYNPIWYSFALFLPYIDLGIASKWEPNPCRKWVRNYKYVHMMLGWVLAPIALLTFSGIIG